MTWARAAIFYGSDTGGSWAGQGPGKNCFGICKVVLRVVTRGGKEIVKWGLTL